MQFLIPDLARDKGGLAAAIILSAVVGIIFAGEPATNFRRARRAEYHRAQAQFQSNTNDPRPPGSFARACFDFNDFATNNAGAPRWPIRASPRAGNRSRANPMRPGHYYLAIELGQLADTRRNLAAFKMVKEMEREFKTADDLDEHFDYAGPRVVSACCIATRPAGR